MTEINVTPAKADITPIQLETTVAVGDVIAITKNGAVIKTLPVIPAQVQGYDVTDATVGAVINCRLNLG